PLVQVVAGLNTNASIHPARFRGPRQDDRRNRLAGVARVQQITGKTLRRHGLAVLGGEVYKRLARALRKIEREPAQLTALLIDAERKNRQLRVRLFVARLRRLIESGVG